MSRNLHNRVSLFDLDKNEFDTVLRNTGSLIGGSFALYCITGDDEVATEDSDIDVYIPYHQKDKMVQYFIDNDYYVLTCDMHYNGGGYFDGVGFVFPESEGIYAKDTVEHKYTQQKVDLITMDENYTPRCAIERFDMSFLMNHYNGNEFYIKHPGHVLRQIGQYNAVSSNVITCILHTAHNASFPTHLFITKGHHANTTSVVDAN
jgi:hypothetical protein